MQRDQEEAANIDYSSLTRYREVEDKREFDRLSQQFLSQIAELASELERMQPNMKAVERFADVQEQSKTPLQVDKQPYRDPKVLRRILKNRDSQPETCMSLSHGGRRKYERVFL